MSSLVLTPKRYLILTNPATGQVNPLLSLAEELVNRGNQVVFMSSEPIFKKLKKIQSRMGFIVQPESTPSPEYVMRMPLVFYTLGDNEVVADYTDKAANLSDHFHEVLRSKPGQIWAWLSMFAEHVPGATDSYGEVVFMIRDLIESLDPDMIIVDNFSPFAVDGVRLTKRAFIETSPAAASAVASKVNIFRNPMPMSGGRSATGGIFVFFHNLLFILIWLHFIFFNRHPAQRRRYRKEVLGLKPTDIICDSIMTPTPGMLPQQIATISFNVANMDIYPSDAYDNSVYFVGPCFAPKQLMMPSARSIPSSPVNFSFRNLELSPNVSTASTPTIADGNMLEKQMLSAHAVAQMQDPVKIWMDRAMMDSKRVLYLNMGSIFFYNREDYDNIVVSLEMLHEQVPDILVLWKIGNHPQSVQPIPTLEECNLPSYIRREHWIADVETVLSHPALAAFVHHGGGNSYNEALAHGVPQFCISQWVDTHDVGLYIQHSGVGLWAEKSPKFDPSDMVPKLVRLLKDDYKRFRHSALSWKLKCIQAGGTIGTVDIIENLLKSYDFPDNNSKARIPDAI